jgi:SAM-dependent methyltransferase
MDYYAIDWNKMWQEESNHSPWNKTSPKDLWNKRAEGFNKRISRVMDSQDELDKDDYISKMLSRIEVKPEWSVLDIGSGPGTLAIPLARKVKSVTALDVSSEMLKYLKDNACKSGITNISYISAYWQEAFSAKKVGEHDVVVASRSLMHGDMKEAISSINSVARQAVYLTLPIIHLPFDWEVYKAIGRSGKKHAPYVYFYNLLYQMGITANVEILRSRVKVQYSDIEKAIDDLQWRTEPFNSAEKIKLEAFLRSMFTDNNGTPVITYEGYSKWALIWWKKEDNQT